MDRDEWDNDLGYGIWGKRIETNHTIGFLLNERDIETINDDGDWWIFGIGNEWLGVRALESLNEMRIWDMVKDDWLFEDLEQAIRLNDTRKNNEDDGIAHNMVYLNQDFPVTL